MKQMNTEAKALLSIASQACQKVRQEPSKAIDIINESRRELATRTERIRGMEAGPLRKSLLEIVSETEAYLSFSMDCVDRPDTLAGQMNKSQAIIEEAINRQPALFEEG